MRIHWFADGVLNTCANCLDRHLLQRADRTAVLWESDDPADQKVLTYAKLHREVCRFTNILKTLGVRKGVALRKTFPENKEYLEYHNDCVFG